MFWCVWLNNSQVAEKCASQNGITYYSYWMCAQQALCMAFRVVSFYTHNCRLTREMQANSRWSFTEILPFTVMKTWCTLYWMWNGFFFLVEFLVLFSRWFSVKCFNSRTHDSILYPIAATFEGVYGVCTRWICVFVWGFCVGGTWHMAQHSSAQHNAVKL